MAESATVAIRNPGLSPINGRHSRPKDGNLGLEKLVLDIVRKKARSVDAQQCIFDSIEEARNAVLDEVYIQLANGWSTPESLGLSSSDCVYKNSRKALEIIETKRHWLTEDSKGRIVLRPNRRHL